MDMDTALCAGSGVATTATTRPFRRLSVKERVRGVVDPQAGLGHLTVRAQIYDATGMVDPADMDTSG